MTCLRIDHLLKEYPGKGFTLQVEKFTLAEGSITALLGPNGAGKSTLLKLTAGLSFPDRGGFIWPALSGPLVQRISYMPQEKDLYPHLTVSRTLSLAAGLVPGWDAGKARRLLERFSLPPHQTVGTLSYGESTQLYAIIALAKAAPVLILDEPTRGLDPVMQEHMLSHIKQEINCRQSILFSSHQLAEVETTADFVLLMKNGRLILQGDLDDLRAELYRLIIPLPEGTVALPEGAEILARRGEPGRMVLLCRGARPASYHPEPSPVSLKDIFLTIMEGEEEKNELIH